MFCTAVKIYQYPIFAFIDLCSDDSIKANHHNLLPLPPLSPRCLLDSIVADCFKHETAYVVYRCSQQIFVQVTCTLFILLLLDQTWCVNWESSHICFNTTNPDLTLFWCNAAWPKCGLISWVPPPFPLLNFPSPVTPRSFFILVLDLNCLQRLQTLESLECETSERKCDSPSQRLLLLLLPLHPPAPPLLVIDLYHLLVFFSLLSSSPLLLFLPHPSVIGGAWGINRLIDYPFVMLLFPGLVFSIYQKSCVVSLVAGHCHQSVWVHLVCYHIYLLIIPLLLACMTSDLPLFWCFSALLLQLLESRFNFFTTEEILIMQTRLNQYR